MKRIKMLLMIIIALLVMPNMVNAASGSIKVTGTSTAVLGNDISITVTISSSTKIGSWQMDLNYDKSYLKLIKGGGEAGGTSMANSSASGIKSKSYTFKFRTLKKGSTKISVSSYLAYAFSDMSEINLSTSSKTVKIITKEELEATYSSNANLKKLEVEGYEITPSFKASNLEYSLEVENDVESVKINASVADSKSDISGSGKVDLLEGNNKFEVIVTAQKGNRQVYTLNIYRKELNPITVFVSGKNLSIIRKSDSLPEYNGFTLTEIEYDGEKIPALTNEATEMTLIGLKDEEGTLYTYIYNNNEIDDQYYEIIGNQLTITPLKLPILDMDNYKKKKVIFNELEMEAYVLSDDSKMALIYGKDTTTGDEGFYQIDLVNNTMIKYNSEIDEYYQQIIDKYKYVIYGFVAITIILILIIILKKPNKIAKKNNQKMKKSIKYDEDDISEEKLIEEIREIKVTKDNENKTKEISKKDMKKLEKDQKKNIKKEKRRAKEKKDFDF